MSIFGNLNDASLASLLQWGTFEKMTGVITLTSPGGMGRIFLKNGRAVYAECQNRRLRSELVSRGLVSLDAFIDHLEGASGDSLIQRVLELELVAREDLSRLLRDLLKEALATMLGWDEGSFTIETTWHFAGLEEVVGEGLKIQEFLLDVARVEDESQCPPEGSVEPSFEETSSQP